jgi:transcriptional regulator with XRE-family HTH domain
MTTLRVMRLSRLLTIRALAQQAQVSPSTIYLIEAGRTTPSLSVMRRLAAALGVEPHEIEEFQRAIEQAGVRRTEPQSQE